MKRIITIPDSRLTIPSRPVEPGENISNLIEALKIQCRRNKAAGLAAPQLGMNLRVFIVAVNYPRINYKIYVNPTYTVLPDMDGTKEIVHQSEGCLSIPERQFWVPRFKSIKVSYENERRIPVTDQLLHDYDGRVFQHEYDHLDGKLINEYKEIENKEYSRA